MKKFFLEAVAAFLVFSLTGPAVAENTSFEASSSGSQLREELLAFPYFNWMSKGVKGAWNNGYLGQKTSIIVVDDFFSGNTLSGDLGTGVYDLTHGQWTLYESSLIAPGASMYYLDHSNSGGTLLLNSGFNVVNCSYGMIGQAGYSPNDTFINYLDESLISYAKLGKAVIVKAAGNDSVAVNKSWYDYDQGRYVQDYFNLKLIGAKSAIYVGALSSNGSPKNKARLAWYSNKAGGNKKVQSHFLVVGVDGGATGLHGTSFAAPIVSGYAAILHSKFKTASPTKIANQLLNTARTDTIVGYKRSVHGVGEASIARALAPRSLN